MSPRAYRWTRVALVAGAVLGFGSGFAHLQHHRHHADALTRVCVDAALGRDGAEVGQGRHGRWVAERCAAHAQRTAD